MQKFIKKPNPEYTKLTENLYAQKQWWDSIYPSERHYEIVKYISQKNPSWIFTAQSAAIVHKIPRLQKYDYKIHIGSTKRRNNFNNYVYHKDTYAYSCINNIKVNTISGTLFSLANTDSLESLIISIEHCLFNQKVTKSVLNDYIAQKSGYRYIKKFKRAVDFSGRGSESPLESMARILINRAGMPEPVQQYRVGKYYADMCWPDSMLILELDGAMKYTSNEVLIQEKKRQDFLNNQGYRVYRCMYDNLEEGIEFCKKVTQQKKIVISRQNLP
jgi:very-short-patch-repair endonuclease